MNSFELMHALSGASEEFVEEALSEPLNNEEQPVTGVQFSEGSGESENTPHRLLLTVLSVAACLTIAAGLGAVIWRLNRPNIAPEISANTSQTEPADSGLDGDTPTGEPSDVTGHTETQTTVSAQTETAASTETTAGAAETESRTNPRTAAVSTSAVTTMQTAARTTATVSQGTRAVTSRSDTAPETVTTTVQRIQQADPAAVIAQLRAGYAHEFDWQGPCEIDYVPYGVAFLCRDSDLPALKTGSIGQYPVNWSDGAWTDFGGSGCRVLEAAPVDGATADNCLVQPVSGFAQKYGQMNAGHSFTFHYRDEVMCSVKDDYSEFAQDGWTVCMASVEAALCLTPDGMIYRDDSALIEALAEKPETVLLGIVYGEEHVYADIFPGELLLHIPGDAPDPAAFAAYGLLYSLPPAPTPGCYYVDYPQICCSETGWYALKLSDAVRGRFCGNQGNIFDYAEMQQVCSELMQLPGVRLAHPAMAYLE